MGGREVREGILGDQGNRSGKQTDEEEREREGEVASSGKWDVKRFEGAHLEGIVRPKATMAS